MTNHDLAELIFPNITKTIADYEEMYPKRNLAEGAKVTRYAPSPTGFMHIGNFLSAVIDYVLAKNSEGVFFLRNEDTDKAREVENAVESIMKILSDYDIYPDEYEYSNTIKGEYGPYIQSERKEIYHTFIKHLIEIGRAYPCFCSKETLEDIRKNQELDKERTGYYGDYAFCRQLTIEEQIQKIKAGIPYVIRFKSSGDFNKKFVFDDLVKGKIELPENDQDIPIMKSDNLLPTYHFAHLVDDYLMRTTHVVRGEEWLSSVPIHIDLFKAFGFKPPKYIHIPLILKKDEETGNARKISKRKDKEASMKYYEEKGYPPLAVIEAIMTIANSNYEEWHQNHPDLKFTDFPFSPKKMSSSGAYFDLEKLDNISKNYISTLKKEEVYDSVLSWAKKYDPSFHELLLKEPLRSVYIFNIEREQKKPRKDFVNWSSVKEQIAYLYDEYFFLDWEKTYQELTEKEDVQLLKEYAKIYQEFETEDEWFTQIKHFAEENNYAPSPKMYREDPTLYKGHVGMICESLRHVVTGRKESPNLFQILKIIGQKGLLQRIEFYEKGLK